MLSDMPPIRITDEMTGPSKPDLLQQIQARQVDDYIRKERATAAAVCGDEVAWSMWPPTRSDDPAEYAPYWQRLSDVVTDEAEREAIVASALSHVCRP
jgi:hypothetical protein